jgi:hypothetical protein
MCAEFATDVPTVASDRGNPQIQKYGNLFRGFPLSKQFEDFKLSGGK